MQKKSSTVNWDNLLSAWMLPSCPEWLWVFLGSEISHGKKGEALLGPQKRF